MGKVICRMVGRMLGAARLQNDASIVPYKWFASFVAISKVSPRQDEGIPPYSTFIGRQHIIKCSVGNGQDRLLRMLYPVLQSITRILQFCAEPPRVWPERG